MVKIYFDWQRLEGNTQIGFANEIPYLFFTFGRLHILRSKEGVTGSDDRLTVLIICIPFFFKYELTHFVAAVVCTSVCLSAT